MIILFANSRILALNRKNARNHVFFAWLYLPRAVPFCIHVKSGVSPMFVLTSNACSCERLVQSLRYYFVSSKNVILFYSTWFSKLSSFPDIKMKLVLKPYETKLKKITLSITNIAFCMDNRWDQNLHHLKKVKVELPKNVQEFEHLALSLINLFWPFQYCRVIFVPDLSCTLRSCQFCAKSSWDGTNHYCWCRFVEFNLHSSL